jgi:hypothetical protein
VEVEYAFLADAADAPPNGKLYVLGAGIDHIYAQRFPAVHATMTVVVKLAVHPSECGVPRTMTIDLWDSDAHPVGVHVEHPFQAQRNELRPGSMVYVQLVLNLVGLRFESPGDYSFEVMVDGSHKKSIPLTLIEQSHRQEAPAEPMPPPA